MRCVLQLPLQTTSLYRSEGVDWWCVRFKVPEAAEELNMAFSDRSSSTWDNNHGDDYILPVKSAAAAVAALSSTSSSTHASSRYARMRSVRTIAHVATTPHAGGALDVVELAKRPKAGSGSSSRSHWWDERRIRVWTPPGFSREAAPLGGWPVVYMCDGSNMFEDWLAHQGVSWRLGYAAAHLIGIGAIPPCVLVAIDSAGPYRSYNYLPYAPGTGEGGFRGDAEKWPGGGADDFLGRVVGEIMPLVEENYNTAMVRHSQKCSMN